METVLLLRKAMQPAQVAYRYRMPHMGLALVVAHGLLAVDDLQICQSSKPSFLTAFDDNQCHHRAYQSHPDPFRSVAELLVDAASCLEGFGGVLCC